MGLAELGKNKDEQERKEETSKRSGAKEVRNGGEKEETKPLKSVNNLSVLIVTT